MKTVQVHLIIWTTLISDANLYKWFTIFTYFQLINICSPYEFVDILMTEILKVVDKSEKLIEVKDPREARRQDT